MKVIAELKAQDFIEMDTEDPLHLKVIGCMDFLNLIRSQIKNYGQSVSNWPLPVGVSHGELLLKEVLQKQKGLWNFPYPHEELCHCRAIKTETVDQAIIAGAHTPQKVSRLTSASTACGTCRPDVEKILKSRLAA